MSLPVVRTLRVLTSGEAPADRVTLDYESRLVRRRRLTTDAGRDVLVDLPQTVGLTETDALVLTDGTVVGIVAADEDLIAVTGPLVALAWHIGNRHTPCEISDDRIVIRDDAVMRTMLAGLGALVTPFRGPFRPGGGAYGVGRVMGHSHGHHHDKGPVHEHDHEPNHGHDHDA